MAGAIALVAGFYFSLDPAVRFVAPGRATIEVAAPGKYVLWHEYRTVFGERSYNTEPALPAGVRFSIRAPDGAALPLESAGSQSWNEGDVARKAVGRFSAQAPGPHVVTLEGSFDPRVMAVTRDFLMGMFGAIGGALLLALIGIGGGIGMAAYAAGRRPPGAPHAPRPARAPVPDSQKALRDITMVVYLLQALSFLFGFSIVAGAIINYIKRDEVAGTWLESHFRWQIRTFWWTLAWAVVGFLTTIVLVGFLILIAAAVWLIYRVAVGWIDLNAGEPIDAD